MKLHYIVLFICIAFIYACKKPTVNEGRYTGHFQIYKSCGVPLANRPVYLYLSHGNTKFELVAEKWTDSLGRVDIEHYYTSMGTLTLKVVTSTITGTKYTICDYMFNYLNKEYSMEFTTYAGGSQIPVQLNNYASYTNSDTVFYRVLGNIGDTNDVKLRYKIGSFSSPFIDTLTFPNCSFPYIMSKSDFVEVSENSVQQNLLIWGKGYNEYLNYEALNHLTTFQQPGCGFVDTAIIQ